MGFLSNKIWVCIFLGHPVFADFIFTWIFHMIRLDALHCKAEVNIADYAAILLTLETSFWQLWCKATFNLCIWLRICFILFKINSLISHNQVPPADLWTSWIWQNHMKWSKEQLKIAFLLWILIVVARIYLKSYSTFFIAGGDGFEDVAIPEQKALGTHWS